MSPLWVNASSVLAPISWGLVITFLERLLTQAFSNFSTYSPGQLVKMQIPLQWVWGSAFLTSSQVLQKLPVYKLHLQLPRSQFRESLPQLYIRINQKLKKKKANTKFTPWTNPTRTWRFSRSPVQSNVQLRASELTTYLKLEPLSFHLHLQTSNKTPLLTSLISFLKIMHLCGCTGSQLWLSGSFFVVHGLSSRGT